MKFSTILLVFGLFTSLAKAQDQAALEANNLSAVFHASGMLFNNPDFNSNSEFPSNSGLSTIYLANLILGAKDNLGNPQVASQTYHLSGRDFSTGPIADIYSQAYETKYNRVWKVSSDQIQTHILSFASPLYTMPEAIENWPGNGNVNNGEAEELAPYFDFNNNGVYDPENGDYPQIRGKEAILFILNDTRMHAQTGGNELGLEIIGMAYAYESTPVNTALGNTVFVNYIIRNASEINYTDFRMASFIDFDLGNYLDDRLGWNSDLNMLYCYNGDDNDEGTLGYGTNPPAQGIIVLDSDTMAAIHEGPISPVSDIFYENYLAEEGVHINTQFVGDVSGMIGSRSFGFNAGQSICYDLAFVFASSSSGGAQASVQQLENDAQTIKTFFQNLNVDCGIGTIGMDEKVIEELHIYPNPSNGIVTIDLLNNKKIGLIELINLQGEIIYVRNGNLSSESIQLDFSDLAKGLYLLRLQSNHYLHSQKLMLH